MYKVIKTWFSRPDQISKDLKELPHKVKFLIRNLQQSDIDPNEEGTCMLWARLCEKYSVNSQEWWDEAALAYKCLRDYANSKNIRVQAGLGLMRLQYPDFSLEESDSQ